MGRGGRREGAGRKPGGVNTDRKEVLAIFREAAPGLLELAIKRAVGYTEEAKNAQGEIETITVAGDNGLLKELVKKALPDNINLGVEDQTVKAFMAAIMAHRPPGVVD